MNKFQALIKSQFGYEARKTVLDTNVLVLAIARPEAPSLIARSGNPRPSPFRRQDILRTLTAYSLPSLAGQLEYYVAMPVEDQTGLTGGYNIHLDWNVKQADPDDVKVAKLRQALLDQLGLDLIPTNMPTEMFVVEKVHP
jgi:uncharacterized protein (TIGR03435 family)